MYAKAKSADGGGKGDGPGGTRRMTRGGSGLRRSHGAMFSRCVSGSRISGGLCHRFRLRLGRARRALGAICPHDPHNLCCLSLRRAFCGPEKAVHDQHVCRERGLCWTFWRLSIAPITKSGGISPGRCGREDHIDTRPSSKTEDWPPWWASPCRPLAIVAVSLRAGSRGRRIVGVRGVVRTCCDRPMNAGHPSVLVGVQLDW